MIVGAIALVRPVRITRDIMVNEIPMVVLSSTAILAIGMAPLLGVPGAAMVSRVDGILLLLFFLIFMHYILQQARHPVPGADPAPDATPATKKEMGLLKGVIWVLGGLAALVIGGDIFVKERLESLVVSVWARPSSALPSWLWEHRCLIWRPPVAAARKGNTGIAVGNVIGSCVFNAFMVLGAAAAVRPLPFGGIGMTDLVTPCRSISPFLAVRMVLQEADHHPMGRRRDDTLLHRLHHISCPRRTRQALNDH